MAKQFLTMSKKWTLDSNRNWVNSSSEKAGIVTESSWYNGKGPLFGNKSILSPLLGGNIMRVRAYKENEKEHFKKVDRCKVTSNGDDYTLHQKRENNWLEHDNWYGSNFLTNKQHFCCP